MLVIVTQRRLTASLSLAALLTVVAALLAVTASGGSLAATLAVA